MYNTIDNLHSSSSVDCLMSSQHAKVVVPPHEHDSPSRHELIHMASIRLRRRQLEEGLSGAKSKVTRLQSELDDLRIELTTTESVLSKFGQPDDRQLQALERRFNTHQQQLDHLLSSCANHIDSLTKPSLPDNAVTASTSFSSTLTRMSSIFSSKQQQTPSVTSDISSTYTGSSSTQEDKDRRSRRRQRVKQLRQEYQQRLQVYDPTWNGDWKSTSSSTDNKAIHSTQKPSRVQPSTVTKDTIASIKKRSSTKQPTAIKKSPIPASQFKSPHCLCKRKTNKQEPDESTLDQHAISSTPLADNHPTIPNNGPPSQSNVSEWLLAQRHYLDQQQDNLSMDDMQQDTQLTKRSPSLKNHSSSLFDDVLHYLDTFSDFSYDATLEKDLTQLLSPMNDQHYPRPMDAVVSPGTSQRPLSFYQQTRVCHFMANCGMVNGSRYLLHGVNKGLSWFKFLGVLSLALVISLGRGPDHMLLSLDEMDYLDLMADQGDSAYTYYL
ncbi:hypothetical protein BC941DRAFT_500687 [Chlamydoabsidia padenii]|nr:hypothetical protein BC941DRAFT_500687 [Chlamydoabsidia padenii]